MLREERKHRAVKMTARILCPLPFLLAAACTPSAPPVDPSVGGAPRGDKVVQIAATLGSTCYRTTAGEVACWGGCPPGRECAFPGPTDVPAARGARAIHGGLRDVCAVLSGGKTVCWSTLTGHVQELSTPSPPRQIVQGLGGLCVLADGGDVTCWSGESFDGAPPTAIVLRKADALSGSFSHSCAIQTDGRVTCWTSSIDPARILGPEAGRALGPALVPGIRGARQLCASFAGFSCVSDASGATSCWGEPSAGQLVPIHGVREPTRLAATGQGACALQRDGTVVCWPFGQGPSASVAASAVAGLKNVVDLTAGANHVCALHADGEIDCWGENGYAQLGNGGRDPVEGLVRVRRAGH